MATCYWKNDSGSSKLWSDTARWFTDAACTTAKGAAPATGDTILFNANGQGDCQITSSISMASIDFQGGGGSDYISTLLQNASTTISITGTGIGLRFSSGMTYNKTASSSNLLFTNNNNSLTTAGKSCGNVTINVNTRTLTLADDLSCYGLNASNGSINCSNRTVTTASTGTSLTVGNLASCSINLSGATLNNSGGFSVGVNASVTVNTSTTINMTGTGMTFAGAGKTYNDLNFTGSGTLTITGANTFRNLSVASTSTITFTGGGFTATNSTLGGASGTINVQDANTWGVLTIAAGKTINFKESVTQTVTDFLPASGSTLHSQSSGTQWEVCDMSGSNVLTGVTIKDSNATGGATFLLINCTDEGNNTGWIKPGGSMFFVSD